MDVTTIARTAATTATEHWPWQNSMRALSILCFLIGGVLAVGGVIQASKPSISPLVAVIGAFAFPALFIWWGLICHKRAKNARQAKGEQE